MACKGCGNRRERLQQWFRRLIGVDQIFVGIGRGMKRRSEIAELRINECKAEQDIGFKIVIKSVVELEEKQGVLRALVKDAKSMVRTQDDKIRDLENEVAGLTEQINKMEFPEFVPIEYKVTDLMEG